MKKPSFKNPRFRHGAGSVLLVLFFLAVCILVNVCVKKAEDHFGWWVDMSFNNYASTGEQTKELLSTLDRDVELYLLYQNGDVDESLHQVLKSYAVLSPKITVKLIDIAKDPGVLTRFIGTETADVAADSIIVNCPETGRYQVLGYQDFMTAGYDSESGTYVLEGLAYEKNLTQAIITVAQTYSARIGILQGHSELTEELLSTFIDVLKSGAYQVSSVNLLSGTTQDELNEFDLLVIASPRNDFTDGEVEMLSAYAKAGGSFFVTRDYTDDLSSMPNYKSFLLNYGVIPLDGIVVASDEDKGSYYENPIYLLPYMTELDMLLSLRQNGEDVLLMPAASAFETPTEGDTSLSVGTVLKSGPHAYLRSLTDGVESIEKQPGDRQGELSLALYAHRMHNNGNISRLFISGSSLMFTEEYIYQRSYCREFLNAILKEMIPEKGVSLNIAASQALRPGLTAGSQNLAKVLTVILPLPVVGLALFILLRRRNR